MLAVESQGRRGCRSCCFCTPPLTKPSFVPPQTLGASVTLFPCHVSSAAYFWTHLEAWADWKIYSIYCPCPVPSSCLTPHSTIPLPMSLDVVARPLSEIQGWDSHCQWNPTHTAPWWQRGFAYSVYRYVLSAWNSAWLVESLQIIKMKKVITIKIYSPSGILEPLPPRSGFFPFLMNHAPRSLRSPQQGTLSFSYPFPVTPWPCKRAQELTSGETIFHFYFRYWHIHPQAVKQVSFCDQYLKLFFSN